MQKLVKAVGKLMLLIYPWALYPCTTLSFVSDQGERVLGKSFDWFDAHGMIIANKRNMHKEALVLDNSDPLEWTARYGSVTFNQHGRDFPLGGMNEAGLVVEIMVGPVQDIPQAPGLKSVNEVQWIQYVLDSFSSIPEVVAGLANVRVARVVSNVHYLVCDKTGDCGSFEYLQGQLVVHSGSTLPYAAFTNSSYEESANYATNYLGLGGSVISPTGSASNARFVRAALAAKQYSGGNAVQYTDALIDNVAISGRWRIVYEGVRKIHFRNDAQVSTSKEVDFNFDFSCRTPVKNYRMTGSSGGSINSEFVDYTTTDNAWLVSQNGMLPFSLQQVMINYPENSTTCLE